MFFFFLYFELIDINFFKDTKPDPGPDPPESFSDVVSLLPPVIWDMAGWGKKFGEVISEPREEARPGETVSAVFVSITIDSDMTKRN